jgi:hypothetical protein
VACMWALRALGAPPEHKHLLLRGSSKPETRESYFLQNASRYKKEHCFVWGLPASPVIIRPRFVWSNGKWHWRGKTLSQWHFAHPTWHVTLSPDNRQSTNKQDLSLFAVPGRSGRNIHSEGRLSVTALHPVHLRMSTCALTKHQPAIAVFWCLTSNIQVELSRRFGDTKCYSLQDSRYINIWH